MGFDYHNPAIINQYHRGDSTDPYQDVEEVVEVVNSHAVLSGIPDKFFGVRVHSTDGKTELFEIRSGFPSSEQYKVHYSTGIVELDNSWNNKQLQFKFKSTGITYLNSKRVFTKYNGKDVTQTLQEMIDKADNSTHNVDEALSKVNTAKQQANSAAQSAQSATSDANSAAKYANNKGDYAQTQGDHAKNEASNLSKLKTDVNNATSSANSAATDANKSATNANKSATKADNKAQFAQTQGDYAKSVGDNLQHEGNFDSKTSYKTGNIVYYQGTTYMAVKDISKGSNPKNNNNWRKINGIRWHDTYSSNNTYQHSDIVADSNHHNLYISIKNDNSAKLSDTNSWSKLVSIDDLETNVDNKIAEVNDLIKNVKNNEDKRKSNETAREKAESKRSDNETSRQSSENTRESAEKKRSSSEDTRQFNEDTRSSNETSRSKAEDKRVSSETDRSKAEKTRESNETDRSNAEKTRDSNETERKNAEKDRASSEQTRQDNEQDRKDAESQRKKAEDTRESNEKTRENTLSEMNGLLDDFEYINEWDKSTTYKKNNVVRYNGSSFISLLNSNKSNKPDKSQDTIYWALMAKRGKDGKGSVSTVNGKSPDDNGNVSLDLHTHSNKSVLDNLSEDKSGGLQYKGSAVGEVTQSEFDSHVNNTNNPHNVNKGDVGLSNITNDKQATESQFNSHLEDYMPHDSGLSQYASNKDKNGIFKTIEYKRSDGSLYLKSEASNTDKDGNYQTIKWNFYKTDGTTVALTKTWTISYDANGNIESKVIS